MKTVYWARPTNLALMLHGDTTELNLVSERLFSSKAFSKEGRTAEKLL